MRKIKNPSNGLIQEIISLRNSRKGSLDDYTFNFLLNYGDHCRLVHKLIDQKLEDELFKVAYRQYFVFLISSWETYFRDMFVYVYAKDEVSTKQLIDEIGIDEEVCDNSDIALSELLSKCFNFQNIEDLENAYNAMWEGNFLKDICSHVSSDMGIDGKVASNFSLAEIFPDWHYLLQQSFSIRHNIVHDANYRIEPDIKFIQKVEVIFLLIPQLASYHVANRYNFRRAVMSNGGFEVPYIFSIRDILSDPGDWEIVE